MKLDNKIHEVFDFGIFIPALLLVIFGLVAIYSSTYNHPTAHGNFERQLVWLIISLGVFFGIYFLPEKTFKWSAFFIYLLGILFLLAVIVAGKKVYGARSWLNLGPVGFQPSEFAKIGTILFMSYFLSFMSKNINSILEIISALAIGILPIGLILLQPDMGTAIVFMVITAVLIFWSGVDLFAIFVVVSPFAAIFASLFGVWVTIGYLLMVVVALFFFRKDVFASASVFVINLASGFFFDYIFTLLQPHQQKRIETFLSPDADPLGSGYNALQAKVAIGSGGLFGRGFMEGNQTQLRFIPEQWTDFIYCVIGEEFGFFGSILMITLFLIIFLRLLNLAGKTKDSFQSFIIIGILALFFVHFAINIGMNVGVTPVIGLPLPLVSYGGSSLLVNMSMLGIAANIYRNRKSRI